MGARSLVIRREQDVRDFINSNDTHSRNEKAIVLIALGGVFIDAYDFSSLSFGLPDITKEFGLSAFAEGVVGASIMVGALIGALAGGYLTDRLGRYRLFMADMLFFVVSAIGCALAPNAETLTAFRFVMGLGIGLDFPVALAFIAEYSSMKARGGGRSGRVTLWQPMWYAATGASFAVLLPLYFLLPSGAHDTLWRYAVGFGAVPALIVMIVRGKYLDESPTWAAGRGDLEGAARILKHTYGVNVTVDRDPSDPPVVRPMVTPRQFARLFEPRYLKRTVLASVVCASQSMQYFAVGFFLPVIISGVFEKGQLPSIIGSLVFNVVFGVTGGFLGVYLASRLGSWRLSLIGFAVCFTVLAVLGGFGTPHGAGEITVAAALIGVFVFFHSGGPGAQGMTMATLSYPTSLRGIGSGFGQAAVRVGSTVSLLWFPTLHDQLGPHAFWAVAVAPLLGLVVLAAVRWEPANYDVDAEDFEPEPVATASRPRRAAPRASQA